MRTRPFLAAPRPAGPQPRDGLRRALRARGSLEHLADHVARPPPHLLVDAADVLADQPQREDLEADEEEQDREQREHPLDLGSDQEAAQPQERAEAETQERHEDPMRLTSWIGSSENPVSKSKLSRSSRKS